MNGRPFALANGHFNKAISNQMIYEFGQLAVSNRKRTENDFIYVFFTSRNIFIDF